MANKNTKSAAPADETAVEEKPVLEDKGVAEETVSKAQYDALLNQAQELANEANRRINALDEDKKVLQGAIKTITALVERVLAKEEK